MAQECARTCLSGEKLYSPTNHPYRALQTPSMAALASKSCSVNNVLISSVGFYGAMCCLSIVVTITKV